MGSQDDDTKVGSQQLFGDPRNRKYVKRPKKEKRAKTEMQLQRELDRLGGKHKAIKDELAIAMTLATEVAVALEEQNESEKVRFLIIFSIIFCLFQRLNCFVDVFTKWID